MDDELQQYLTINTHLGLYRYKRFPSGISSAPAIFQSVMDTAAGDADYHMQGR